ncbi:MAG TPA: hypothetical protein VL096_20350 [Pirellulaceae bacterium]|nr:hypothetical protein [Pirellulaceae bacterium]
MLDREEYIEQAYFFKTLGERLPQNHALQELLSSVKDEVLATTKLPMALDYMLAELKHTGNVHSAMARLPHYFTAFQTYLMQAAEDDRGRFDIRVAVEVLRFEAQYKGEGASVQGLFLYQFEVLSRNRLRYDHGLAAMARDPMYNAEMSEFIRGVRLQIGIIDLADMIYVRSAEYQRRRNQGEETIEVPEMPVLFGEKEGRIALANRRKDPLFLFSALQRQLGYPAVPRPVPIDTTSEIIPQLARRLERMEVRLKLMEEEQKGGIDITKFYGGKMPLPPAE